jgi:hypothetical protein
VYSLTRRSKVSAFAGIIEIIGSFSALPGLPPSGPQRPSKKRFRDGLLTATAVTKHLKLATEMMRADAGLHSDQGQWQVGEPRSTWPRDYFCRSFSTASVMGRPSATIVPLLHSAVSNLIRTPSSRSDMSGCRRRNSFRTVGAPAEISPFVTSNMVLKSGVPSRSTVIRTFIAVLRSCRCSVQGCLLQQRDRPCWLAVRRCRVPPHRPE